MKKLLLILVLLTIGLPGRLPGQTQVSGEDAGMYSKISQEDLFVHYNTSLLFSGEYFYYKIYTLGEASGRLSSLSKIAYVELIAEDGTRIFKHKVQLKRGTGQGDFFLPTTVPSGNYKLVAYTRWMLNHNRNFFSGDVAVINPYRGDQRAITLPTGDSTLLNTGSSVISSEAEVPPTKMQVPDIRLELDRSLFGKREQVMLKLKSKNGGGNYSVSVRKKENFDAPPMVSVVNRVNTSQKASAERDIPVSVYLPELRGELLTGRIKPKEVTSNLPIHKRNLTLSIPGEDYMIKVAGTNERGEFFFNLNGTYSGDRALLEIIGEDKNLYAIEVDPTPGIDHGQLTYHKFYLTPVMEELILERSVYNQIENAYYGVKPDTVSGFEQRQPFYEELPVVYKLDDFTRFPSIRETFTEIIAEAAIRRNSIMVRIPVIAMDYGMPSLLIVDGAVVQDQGYFLNTPATEIESIAVIPQNYYLGPHMFQGVIDVVTINKDFWERYAPASLEHYNLEKPQPKKNYFKQSYRQGKNEHIPDFRLQLLWQPEITLLEGDFQLEFYTGDITGDFEIVLQGYSGKGEAVFISGEIRVE